MKRLSKAKKKNLTFLLIGVVLLAIGLNTILREGSLWILIIASFIAAVGILTILNSLLKLLYPRKEMKYERPTREGGEVS